ncbi:MAG: isochorismatase family protein [Acidimicrobiia bacterium]|nr:isochorismatase family protein [Acidimicrobiia bacterium]MBT8249566.1 isochorismatase family protein [Acidimicrobiia bacterium]NNC42428.1 isochorismatase family protein [Acidimicrobiia bacterium]NNL27739.1 isochorismatase family protein [Acidimicrobiia bacterium]NNL47863.1 isochorismatase family protein [Acidimicrobiia bacterium]
MDYDAKTALIVVDVQNDFADAAGSLYVSGGETVVPVINGQISRAREADATVVYTQDWHPESTPHFEKDGGIWPVHCVRDTWGAQFHPDLDVVGPSIRKGTGGEDGYSGFTVRDPESGKETPTGLGSLLLDAGIEKAVVVGLALDYCVKETALDAVAGEFATTLLTDATASVNLQPGDDERALADLEAAGVVLVGSGM